MTIYMITQLIYYCEGNVLQIISLRQLIIVCLIWNITWNSSTIFLDSFQRLQLKILPRLTISSNMIFKRKVKKADRTFIFSRK